MRLIAGLFTALSLFSFGFTAKADTLVSGSTFNVQLQESDATKNGIVQSQSYTLTPNSSISFTFGAASGTITESETVLSNGSDEFSIVVSSTSNLFPSFISGDSYGGSIGVGDSSPLQFADPFDLTSSSLIFGDPSAYVSGEDLTFNPFDGAYPALGYVQGFTNVQGRDTTSIVLDLVGQDVPAPTPEPSSLMLLGTGLAGVAGVVRRKLRRA